MTDPQHPADAIAAARDGIRAATAGLGARLAAEMGLPPRPAVLTAVVPVHPDLLRDPEPHPLAGDRSHDARGLNLVAAARAGHVDPLDPSADPVPDLPPDDCVNATGCVCKGWIEASTCLVRDRDDA